MPLTVTELVARLKHTVELHIGEQCVVGEVGSCKAAASGHIYFTLKDAHAQLQCAMYAFRARTSRVRLREGMQVELYGKATVWEGRGSLQFIVDRVKEAGKGSLQQQFEELKQRLMAEGLFDTSRKRPLPPFPQSVALITSPTGAVIQDMRHRLEQRAPWMQVWLYPVQVQGKGAEYGLADAIRRLGQPEESGLPRVDYLVLARGGGSMEDLWCFNEEILARAIAACPIPVVSAVGHETDFTIADFVADLRAPTPTAAIELTTPDAAELLTRLNGTEQHLRRRLQQSLQMAGLRLKAAAQGKLSRPQEILAPFQQKLDILADELTTTGKLRLRQAHEYLNTAEAHLSPRIAQRGIEAAQQHLTTSEQSLMRIVAARLQRADAQLNTMEARLSASSPQHALDRGFAFVRTPGGKLARRAADFSPGDRLAIRLAEGSLDATVNHTIP
ncbi:MAG: exodeoxyribonuclease VII large subunit [Akkermansia sp.]|nr:exodeoxyribonuclease VII large subunit [Akkermansia sp.]